MRKDIVGRTPNARELGKLSVHDVAALELTRRFVPKPGGDGITHALRPDSVSKADARVGEDGPVAGVRPELTPEAHVMHSAAGQVASSECQPKFARTNRFPFVVSDECPAPAAFQASSRIE